MIQRDETSDGPLLSILGDVDFSNVAALKEALLSLAVEPVVMLSLERATFIDSTVLSVLLGRYRRREGDLVVVVPKGSPLGRIFDVTGLRTILNIVPDLAVARSIAAGKRGGTPSGTPAT